MQQPHHALPASGTVSAPSWAQSVALWFRALVGLVWVEVRGLMPLALGVGGCCVVGLGLARWLVADKLPSTEAAYAAMWLSITIVAALPLTAELFEADWRKGTAKTLQPVPLTWGQSLVSKLAAGALLFAGLYLGIGLADLAMLGFEPVTGGETGSRFPMVPVLFGWLGLTATAVMATVFRNALAATLVGSLLGAAPMVIMFGASSFMGEASGGSSAGRPAELKLLLFCLALSALFLAPTFRLRGRASRSLLRRVGVFAGAGFAVIAVPYATAMTIRRTAPAPEFNDPYADVDHRCSVTPDGKSVLVYMNHGSSMGTYRQSIWAVDLEFGTPRLLPDPSATLHPLMPFSYACFSVASSFDGEKLVGALTRRDHAEGMFTIDLQTEEVEAIDVATDQALINYGGWYFKALRSDDHPTVVHGSRRASASTAPIALETFRSPAVPQRTPSILIYTKHDGWVHRLDTDTNEDVRLELRNEGKRSLRVSPDGRWVLLMLEEGARLYEVETGRHREVGHRGNPGPGDYPLLEHTSRERSEWTLSNLDGERLITPEVPVGTLDFVDEERLIGQDSSEGIHLFDFDGRLIRTLREPSPERQNWRPKKP